MKTRSDIWEVVREKYGAIARGSSSGCCGSGEAQPSLQELGYTEDQARTVPAGSDLGLGCGNPLAPAEVKPGETVLDLGSGAGIDVFLASREVGPTGRVIGVDMTPSMVEKARANAAREGIGNVEFRLGEIERLPVADASVDVVISNCVINLSPKKAQVFREALRVLKPGGRLLVSDIVLSRPLPAGTRESVEAYVGCVAGASLKDEYLETIRGAGFKNVAVVRESRYSAGAVGEGCCGPAASGAGCGESAKDSGAGEVPWDSVASITVRGEKAASMS
jgi:SAM-dependent methyltransferase